MASSYFDDIGEDPQDMDDIYEELKSLAVKEKRLNFTYVNNVFYEKLVGEYEEEKNGLGMRYTYPTDLIDFIGTNTRKENVFACVSRDRKNKDLLNITDLYNINAAPNIDDTDGHINGRFLCRTSWKTCSLLAVAEESATAYSVAKNPVENIYRHMRLSLIHI